MKRILLIEDNAANRKLLSDVLRLGGYEVTETQAAREGIDLALEESFDLIVMDIQLPELDGLAATAILRKDPRTSSVPILAVTAHAMRGDESRILEAGCDGYVSKPIAYKKFLAEVARLISKSEDES